MTRRASRDGSFLVWDTREALYWSLVFWGAVLFVQASLVIVYIRTTATGIDRIRYLIYPFVWINLGLWVALHTRRPRTRTRVRLIAGGIAVAYLVLLLALPGKVAIDPVGSVNTGLSVRMAVPGWGPILAYEGAYLRLHLVPFEAVGYTALAYLVYLNLNQLSRSSIAGGIAVITCVGCTVPVLVPVLGILGGTGTTLASTAYAWSYDIGTAVFVLVVIVLYRSLNWG